MSFKQTVLAFAVGSALAVLGAPAFSQTPGSGIAVKATTNSAGKLATQYSAFAGSKTNAQALISGLRDDKAITLVASPDGATPTAPSASFTPATSKLGYGDINIALSLAKADLAKQGITAPTPGQLAAALNGGAITTATGTVTMAGILAQRESGMGWGQIANAMGVKLGSLMSASKTNKVGAKAARAAKSNASDQGQAKGGNGANNGNRGGNSSGNSGSGGAGGGKK